MKRRAEPASDSEPEELGYRARKHASNEHKSSRRRKNDWEDEEESDVSSDEDADSDADDSSDASSSEDEEGMVSEPAH